MAKKSSQRKAKKKPAPKKQRIDDDLTLLAEVLDEHRLDQSISGWFALPWRDGWRAIELAWLLGKDDPALKHTVEKFVGDAIQNRNSSPEIYWQSADQIALCYNSTGKTRGNYMYAAVRCLQVLSSNSSGGGEVYNYLLKRAFDLHTDNNNIDTSWTWEEIVRFVMQQRCYDALKIDATATKSEFFAKPIKAFEIAWKRGLYHAAYAIAPMKTITISSSVWSYAGGKDDWAIAVKK